ncbi:asparagine synthase (glutamine-hydrolyzing) [Bacillaceae bacterium]
MCGIAGWIDWHDDLTNRRPVLERMAERMYWRGPDAAGFWLSKHAAFAHRRLIVVDPKGGGQPMIRALGDRTYTLVYNGELYNTDDLREELAARGHSFRTTSDTEVLLVSFIEWGEDCVEKLNGIFAFAIWDEARQRLFLARDRLGVKPLFFSHRAGSFLFASEIKALLAHPAVEPEIDREGLAEIFALGPARTPGHGVFRGIEELKPGHALVFDRRGCRAYAYWQLESRPHADDFPTTVQRVKELLVDAIERQLVSDVPVCTLLSGGLDSSAISAVAAGAFQRSGKGSLHTYSVDYVDNERYFQANQFQPNADAPWVRKMSDFIGSVHHDITFDTPELVESLFAAVRARDLPGMADIDGSLYLFCREIKKGATVALSGECADEVFGGYPWFHRQEMVFAETFPWSRRIGERSRILSTELRNAIRPEAYVRQRYLEALEEVPRLAEEEAYAARMREMFYLNLTRWMPTLLDRKDRMSMAVGLEVRVPFCDHRLVEYLWNVPWEMKNCDNREKGLLRRALQGILPEDVRTRKKSPYPKTHNPGYLQACRQRMLEILSDPGSPLLPLVDKEAIRALVRESEAKPVDLPWFGQLMNVPQLFAYLMQVDAWLREYRVRIV